jgi:hypothetical protein
MLSRAFSLLPALRVHSWGGFGSQLFTAYVILKVQKRYPGRRIKVIVHTSGVTRRVSEFDFTKLNAQVVQIEDFASINRQRKTATNLLPKSLNIIKLLKKIAFRVLKAIRMVQSADTNQSFDSISLWTLALRGHYTRLALDKELISSLYKVLFDNRGFQTSINSSAIIHYRLGDLINLVEKSPISPERVEKVLELAGPKIESTKVLSDSSESEYRKFVTGSRVLSSLTLENLEPLPSLWLCITSSMFIGTGTKLSLWAAIFRDIVHNERSFLPNELKWAEEIGLKADWY